MNRLDTYLNNLVNETTLDLLETIYHKAQELGVTVLPFKESYLVPNDIYITSIEVKEKGQGKGREFMEFLLNSSRKSGRPITLEASSESESSPWLEEWYSRLGFEYEGGWGDYGPYMVYYPK